MRRVESSERCEVAGCHRRAQFELEDGDTPNNEYLELCGPCAKHYYSEAHAKMEARDGAA